MNTGNRIQIWNSNAFGIFRMTNISDVRLLPDQCLFFYPSFSNLLPSLQMNLKTFKVTFGKAFRNKSLLRIKVQTLAIN